MTKWVPPGVHEQCYKCSQLSRSPYLQNTGQESLNTPSWLICSLPTILFSKNWRIESLERASQVVLVVKNPQTNAGDLRDKGSILGLGRSPAGGNGNPLAWKIPWTEEPVGLPPMKSQSWTRMSTHRHLESIWNNRLRYKPLNPQSYLWHSPGAWFGWEVLMSLWKMLWTTTIFSSCFE